MYQACHLIYIIITISTAWYFNQYLPVSYTIGSSYRSPYSSRSHPNMKYGYHYPNERGPNNKRSCHHHCLYCSCYVNWKPNGQGVLIEWVHPVHPRDYGLTYSPGCWDQNPPLRGEQEIGNSTDGSQHYSIPCSGMYNGSRTYTR